MGTTTRRAFLAATAAAGLTPSSGRPAAAAASGELVASLEGDGIERLARFGSQSSDQWPCVSLGGDPGEYVAAHGDGIGLVRDSSSGRTERVSFGFSRLRITPERGGFAVRG